MNYNSVDYWNDGIGYYGAINYVIADRVEGSPQRLQYRGVVWQYDYSITVVVVVVGGWVVIIRLMCF